MQPIKYKDSANPVPKCPPCVDENGKPIKGTHNNWLVLLQFKRLSPSDLPLCSKCKKNRRHITSKGDPIPYCRECVNSGYVSLRKKKKGNLLNA